LPYTMMGWLHLLAQSNSEAENMVMHHKEED
jgi:hypothetical protein